MGRAAVSTSSLCSPARGRHPVPTAAIFPSRHRCSFPASCSTSCLTLFGTTIAAAKAAAIVVPNKVRQEVEHDAGNEQRCLDGKIAAVGTGCRPRAGEHKLDVETAARPIN